MTPFPAMLLAAGMVGTLASSGRAQTVPPQPSLAHLANWIGYRAEQDPARQARDDRQFVRSGTFFDDPALRRLLLSAYGSRWTIHLLSMWESWAAPAGGIAAIQGGPLSVPIEVLEGGTVLDVSSVKIHDAWGNTNELFVNVSASGAKLKLQACWSFTDQANTVNTYWLANDRPPRQLPRMSCQRVQGAAALRAYGYPWN